MFISDADCIGSNDNSIMYGNVYVGEDSFGPDALTVRIPVTRRLRGAPSDDGFTSGSTEGNG